MKKMITVSIVFIILIVLIALYANSRTTKDLLNLDGEIVLSNPDYTKFNGKGVLKYNLSNREQTVFFENENFTNIFMKVDNTKIFMGNNNNEIFGYDLKEEGGISFLLNANTGAHDYSIIPHQDKISFVSNNQIIIYDLKYKKISEIKLLNNIEDNSWLAGYCWAKDGKSLVFSDGTMIYSYYLEIKEMVPLMKGRYPVYSTDDKYLLLINDSDYLIVNELETGKNWTYRGKSIFPIFSPNNDFVAFQIQSKKTLSKGRELIVWDFRNSKEETLFQDISMDKSGQFIWN